MMEKEYKKGLEAAIMICEQLIKDELEGDCYDYPENQPNAVYGAGRCIEKIKSFMEIIKEAE